MAAVFSPDVSCNQIKGVQQFNLLLISGKLNLSPCDCLFLVPDTNLTNIRLEILLWS